jgi:hypothetical protein
MMTMNHNNKLKRLLNKRNLLNKFNHKRLKSKDPRLASSNQDLKMSLTSMVLPVKRLAEPEALEREVAVVAEVDAVAEAAVAREEKAVKKEEDIAVAEVAVVREEKELKVKNQEVKTIDPEAVEEVEVVPDLKVKKVETKVFSMFKERRDLTTLAKKSISKARKPKNGTHMTDNLEPAEVEEMLTRMATEEETGVSQKMKLRLLLLELMRPHHKRRPRRLPLKSKRMKLLKRQLERLSKSKRKKKRRKEDSLFKNTWPRKRLLVSVRKPDKLSK